MNTLMHETTVTERIVVEDAEQLASALRYFGEDLPLDGSWVVELLVEKLSDKSEVSTIRIRPAERVA